METLLVVLVIICALAFVVQVGRGIWARTRTVERHQQALDTLAGLTQRPDTPDEASGGGAEHQAHVRLIGPGGQVSPAETAPLPPPRALPSSASPFRRPSRTAPSAAALEAAASSSAYLASAEAPPLPPVALSPAALSPQAQSPAAQSPATQLQGTQPVARQPNQGTMPGPETVPGQQSLPAPEAFPGQEAFPAPPAFPGPETIPGLPPQPAPPAPPTLPPGQLPDGGVFVEPPTVPVPIVQPQVFYFDDLSSRGETPDGPAAKHRRLSRRRRHSDVTAEHLLPVAPPPPALVVSEKTSGRNSAGRGSGGHSESGPDGRDGAHTGGRRSVVGLVLAAAAICVAVVAIGVTVVGLPGHSSPGVETASQSGPPSSAVHQQTTTTVRPRPTTTTAAPAKPAVLVSTQNGTATYDLRSASASIVVSASGPCWLEVRANSPLGQIVYEGTLEAGGTSRVTGPAWIRLGNPPVVAVKVDGTPMTVPDAEVGLPLNLQFTLG